MNADGANEILAGALRIECVELSRTGSMGIKLLQPRYRWVINTERFRRESGGNRCKRTAEVIGFVGGPPKITKS